jgi:hypothetical protein
MTTVTLRPFPHTTGQRPRVRLWRASGAWAGSQGTLAGLARQGEQSAEDPQGAAIAL